MSEALNDMRGNGRLDRETSDTQAVGGWPRGGASFRAVVEGSLDVVLIADPDGTLRCANPAVERVLGYAPEELVGCRVAGLVHPEDLGAGSNGAAPSTRRYRHKDGSWRYLEGTHNDLSEDPEVRGVVITTRDVTGRVEAEARLKESEERHRALVENAHDFVVLADRNNVATYVSPAIEPVLGYTPEEFVGTVIASYGHPYEAQAGARAIAETLSIPGPHNLGAWRYRHKDGSYRWLEVVVSNRLEDPVLRGVVCNCRDVTERVEAEQKLKESEGWFRTLTQNAPDMIFVLEEDGGVRYASPSAGRLLGYDLERELVGHKVQSLFHPDDRFDAESAVAAARELPEAAGLPGPRVRVRHKDGSWRVLEGFLTDLLDDPDVRGLVFNSRDITRQVEIEDALRASEERHRALVENAYDFVALADENNVALYGSPSIERILGWSPDEFVGSVIASYLHPDDLEDCLQAVEKSLVVPGPQDLGVWRYRCKDGSYRWLEVVVNNRLGDPKLRGVICNCRDVTERREIEERLRESEERFRGLVENAHDFVVLADENNVALYASPSIERIMGYTPEEFEGTVISGYAHPEDASIGEQNVSGTIDEFGAHAITTLRYRHKDGSYRYIEVNINNRLDDPSLRGVVCNCRDVTERIEAERKLRESEERHRALVENAHDFVALADENNVFRYINPAIERVMGYTPEELIGTVVADLIHPEDVEAGLRNVAESLAKPGPHTLSVVRFKHKDGSYRHIEAVVNNKLEDPVLRGVVCNCRDVTERVAAEQRLRESEERHRALNENALDLVLIQAPDSTLSYASPSMKRLLGYDPEEEIGKRPEDFIHPDDLEWAWPVFYKQLQTPGVNDPVTIRYRHKDGRWRWFESACNNQLENPAVGGLVFNCRDVTERVEAKEKLREAEERYRLLVEQVPAVTYIERNDTESSTVYVSPQVGKMLGYEPEEWRSDPGMWLRTLHPEDHGRVFARHLRCNETGEPFDEEYRCFARDGREVWVRDEARLVRDEEGQPLYWQGVKVDITARKQAELEILRLNTDLRGQVAGYTTELKAAIEGLKESERYLREREEQFHATFERAAVGIAHVSPKGRWLRVNEKLCEILGYAREELLARSYQDLTHPEDVDADVRQAERLLRGEIEEYSMEKRYIRRDGAVIWASLSVSMVKRGAEASGHFISVIEDITKRKRAEAILKVLSPREVEVLREMVAGRSNVEIAAKFGSSMNTIKAQLRSILEKLEVTDRTSAAVYAAEVGLFSQEFRVPDAPPRAS